MGKYRRIIDGKIDGTFYSDGGAIRYQGRAIKLKDAPANGLYPQLASDYDPNTQILGENLEIIGQTVQYPVYDFEKGIRHDWKDREFKDGKLYRTIRVRVLRADTYQGNILETMADRLLKSSAPSFETDSEGNSEASGGFLETYLFDIDESDLPAIQAYVNATDGAILEYYNDLT